MAKPAPKGKAKAKAKGRAKANGNPPPTTPPVNELHKLQRGRSYSVRYHGGRTPGTARQVFVSSIDEDFVWVVPCGMDGAICSYHKHLIGEVREIAEQLRPATRLRSSRT